MASDQRVWAETVGLVAPLGSGACEADPIVYDLEDQIVAASDRDDFDRIEMLIGAREMLLAIRHHARHCAETS
jgi:hypothetical protein